MRRAARTDSNQSAIVAALRAVGAGVIVTSGMGGGFPDLIVAFRGAVHLVEIKNPTTGYGRAGFNANQRRFNEGWRGAPVAIVATTDEALAVIGVKAIVEDAAGVLGLTGKS